MEFQTEHVHVAGGCLGYQVAGGCVPGASHRQASDRASVCARGRAIPYPWAVWELAICLQISCDKPPPPPPPSLSSSSSSLSPTGVCPLHWRFFGFSEQRRSSPWTMPLWSHEWIFVARKRTFSRRFSDRFTFSRGHAERERQRDLLVHRFIIKKKYIMLFLCNGILLYVEDIRRGRFF